MSFFRDGAFVFATMLALVCGPSGCDLSSRKDSAGFATAGRSVPGLNATAASGTDPGEGPPVPVVYADCPSAGLRAASGAINLRGDCVISGDVNLSGTAALTMTSGVLSI